MANDRPPEWPADAMRASEAAKALGRNKSWVTRALDRNPALWRARQAMAVWVSLGDLERHRDQEQAAQMRRGAATADAAPDERRSPDAPARGGLTREQERKAKADADARELDNAARLGVTMLRADVERTVQTAFTEAKDAMLRLARTRAGEFLGLDSRADAERALDRLVNDALTAGTKRLEDLAAV